MLVGLGMQHPVEESLMLYWRPGVREVEEVVVAVEEEEEGG
jgi:hypothetical protein